MFAQFKRLTWKAGLLATALSLLAVTIALAASGDLDTTFDGDGWVITDVNAVNPGRAETAFGMAIQPNGKIVVVGQSVLPSTTTSDFALARYNPDGSLDATFSGDGRHITNLGGEDSARGVAIQSNGKIVVAGDKCNSSTGVCQLAVVRYNAGGSLDTTFNITGKKFISFPGPGGVGSTGGLAIQSNGRIVVGAGVSNGTDGDFAVYRLNADGSLDTTFSGDGLQTIGFGSGSEDGGGWGSELAIQADGKIVVSGAAGNNFAVARLNRNGTLDTTFSSDGRQTANFGAAAYAFALALQSDGKIVLIGSKTISTEAYFALARFNADGSLDTTFNGTGRKVTNIPGSQHENARGVVIQPDGKIVLAGWADTNVSRDFAIVRYNSNGSPDATFSGDGIATFDFGGQLEFARPIALDGNGKYVLAGLTDDGTQRDFALARVLP
jgi:uncharacterized delta-60 repeat protein